MAKQSSFNNDEISPIPTALKSSQVSEENAYEQKYSPPLPTMAGNSNSFDEKVLSPSNGAFEQSQLEPCEICGRTFNSKALERHIKVCEKVSTKKPAKVFDITKKRLGSLENVPSSSRVATPKKTKIVKPEDEFQVRGLGGSIQGLPSVSEAENVFK